MVRYSEPIFPFSTCLLASTYLFKGKIVFRAKIRLVRHAQQREGNMGLFGYNEPLNPRLKEVWAKPEAHRFLGRMEDTIRRAQSTLLTLDGAERLIMFSVIWSDKYKEDGLIVVTSRHIFEIGTEGNTRKRFQIAQIAEVRHLSSDNCRVVQVLTQAAQLQEPETKKQWPHMILATVATADIAHRISEAIQKLIN